LNGLQAGLGTGLRFIFITGETVGEGLEEFGILLGLSSFFHPLKVKGFEFEVEALGGKIAATKANNVIAELAEAGPLGERVGFVENKISGESGVLEGEPVGKFVGEDIGQYLLLVVGWFLFEILNEIESFLAGEPIAITAKLPVGEILVADGAASELIGKNGADFRQGIKPIEEGSAGFAVLKAVIELLAKDCRKAGDFAGAGRGVIR